jgi:HK97 family phage portal protein
MPSWFDITSQIERRGAPSWWSDKLSWGGLVSTASTRSRVTVTPTGALGLTAVYAAINCIATDVSTLPLEVWKRRRSGGRDRVTDHKIDYLLGVSTDNETPANRFEQSLVGHALGWGNGYAEIEYESNGQVKGLYLLDPAQTRPDRRPQDKRLFYRSGNSTLPPWRMLHIAGFGYDGLQGYSPINLAREAIGLGIAAEQFGAAFFGNSAKPSGVLETPLKLSPQAIANLRESWERMHQGGENAARTAILEQGMKWNSTMIPPEDAQFLETRKFQVLEVARLFRIPPHKIGDYSQSHLANIEAANLDYLQTTILPWCLSIEQELNRKLFTEAERRQGYFVCHDTSVLLRADSKTRGDMYRTLRELGAITPNEIREREGLNPIAAEDGGDLFLVQGQYVPLESLVDSGDSSANLPAITLPDDTDDEPSLLGEGSSAELPAINGRAWSANYV